MRRKDLHVRALLEKIQYTLRALALPHCNIFLDQSSKEFLNNRLTVGLELWCFATHKNEVSR